MGPQMKPCAIQYQLEYVYWSLCNVSIYSKVKLILTAIILEQLIKCHKFTEFIEALNAVNFLVIKLYSNIIL